MGEADELSMRPFGHRALPPSMLLSGVLLALAPPAAAPAAAPPAPEPELAFPTVAQAAAACSESVERFRALGMTWEADPGLGRLARLLSEDPRLVAPMPGIGDVREALRGATVRLTRDLACADESAPGADWVAGAAWPARAYVVVRAGGDVGAVEPVRRVLRHELAHLALHDATGGRASRWLSEGYAQLAAGEWGNAQAWTLRLEFLRGRVSLEDLSLGFPAHQEGAAAAYLLSYTAVQQLLQMGGEPGLRALFEGMAGGARFDSALRTVYGLTENQFEERWGRAVSSRYGVLYVLSRAAVFWIAMTLLLLWVGGRRRRRDRSKLERMRREEAEEAVDVWVRDEAFDEAEYAINEWHPDDDEPGVQSR